MIEPVDTSKLDPATLAKHLGNPEGEIGKAVTANLNRINASAYSAALAKLDVEGSDRILEIGFGNGREIPRVLSASKDASYFGLDISATMVAEATAFNSLAVSEGRMRLVEGASNAIPADQGAFDKALAINTIYFWENPAPLTFAKFGVYCDRVAYSCLARWHHGALLVVQCLSTAFGFMSRPQSNRFSRPQASQKYSSM
jgi:hypothetical protein